MAALWTALLTASLAAEEDGVVRGRVTSTSGMALEHAAVTGVESETTVYSDHLGQFVVPECPLPCLLLITHPRFEEQAVTVTELVEGGLEIEMIAKQAVFERIDVTANRAGDGFAPVSVASTAIRPEERAAAPTTLTELVEGTPGVAENGQGGLFQVFAIRGVSRHRVMTLVSGMAITGERRAGVSTSFIDPLLIGSVDVLRGPSSTYYGSGALGGVVQVFPREFDGTFASFGWNSFGDENHQHVGWGDSETGWSVGFARRAVGDDEGADGGLLNAHYSQVSATLRKRWQRGGRSFEVLAIPTLGRDIGKPNTDFPDRVTNYPQETHLLLKFAMTSPDGSTLQAFVHPNNLVTEVLRVGQSLTEVRNESLELGLSWQRPWSLPSRSADLHGRFGVDYSGRHRVHADERVDRLDGGEGSFAQTLDNARQDEVAAYGSARWAWGATTLQAGARLTWQGQSNDVSNALGGGSTSRDDTAATAFLGLVRPLGRGFELTANVGTGLRFPNLSERFFTGTTGRGQVIGNPDLDSESSLSLDLGLRWYGDRTFLSVQAFRLEIDDYIERIDSPDDTRTFVNLTSGTLRGVEIEGFYKLDDHWLVNWSGHLLDGAADASGPLAGEPLADVSPDRLQAGIEYDRGDWRARLELQHRAEKDDPGSGEIAISSADLVSAALSYRLRPDLTLTLRGRNLLDEAYRTSADDKTSIAPGRSVGLAFEWSAR